MEKPVIQYTIRPQANRASGGVINVPAIIGREDSVPLELIVDRAIDRGLIVAIKPNAAKSVADGVAKQMFEEFRNGNGVKFELNKAKLKADALDAEALAALGLVRVDTLGLKLKAKAA